MAADEPKRTVGLGIALPMTSRGVGTRQLVAELIEEVQAAERHGFELCLVPEHHGGPTHSVNDPMSLIAWLLASTSRITIGSGVLVLPLHSIARLAEQAALLHAASGDRLVLGVGAGYQQADFDLFDVALDDRGQLLDEGLASLKEAWAAGSYRGHAVRPSLADGASPPLLVGAWTKVGMRRAASLADGWLADPIHTISEVSEASRFYRAAAAAAGRPSRVLVMREAWVASTDEEAIATYAPVIEPIFRYYHRNGALRGGPDLTADRLTLPGPLAERVVCGSIETVAAQLVNIADQTHADTVILGLRHPGGPTHDQVMTAITRLGDEVRPRVEEALR